MSISVHQYLLKNFRYIYLLVLVTSVCVLLFSHYIERKEEILICPLWIYAKLLYFALIKLSVTGLLIKKLNKYTTLLIMLTLLCSSMLGLYHSAIEYGILPPSKFSTTFVKIPHHFSIKAIKTISWSKINDSSRDNTKFKILNISLVEWNLLLNLSLLIGIFYLKRLHYE